MCGRFVITSPPDALRQIFGYPDQPNFPPRYNISPTQPVPVVVMGENSRHFRLMRWGLWPAWMKDPRKFTLLINARAETIKEKPAFKNAIRRRRCLIPADGYYEWKVFEGIKRPYFIYPRDGRPAVFAGVAETWAGPNGEEVDTIAIVTASASADLAALHPRVPVTIEADKFEPWLDCRAHAVDTVTPLMRGPREGEFTWHEVSTRVNHAANDDAQLILPITEEQREAESPKAAKKLNPRKPVSAGDDDEQGSLF
ncbi:MAG TPA: SOS response-associated peptidase [Bradyrhizobium sp.]|nr:SOS response-associated peptidase [Bradyrhizobium sp.]